MQNMQYPQPGAMDELAKKLNRSLITQLNAAPIDSEDAPKLFAADLKYARMLQGKRLKAKGVTVIAGYEPDEPPVSGVSWKLDTDARYITRLPFTYVNAKREYSLAGNGKKSVDRKEIFYSHIVWNMAQQPDAPYSCPHCGGATTLGNLTEGCQFCGTRFLASELYPKALQYFTLPAALNVLKRLGPFAIVGAIAMAALGIVYNCSDISTGIAAGGILSLIGWIFYAAIAAACGAFLGYVAGAFSVFFEAIVRAIASIPTIMKYGTAKRRLPNFMRRYSPDFNGDRFVGKLISMLQIIVYTEKEDFDNCALYCGKPIEDDFSDIIDMSYNGTVDVRKCCEKDGYLSITLDLYMNVVSCKDSEISVSNKKIRLTVSRSATAPEDYGFNVKAIQCPHCGGSFDATKEKHCPFCSHEYSMPDYDWVVTEISVK
ncbi:MAG: hypothetical protein IJM51_11350 [Clostridia bacterium]|nr:hypothetical protein [Clostridia bacterium]